MIWNSNLRLLRKRSKCDTTRSIQTTFTIFKQQLEIAWEITYALDLSWNHYRISWWGFFENRKEDISSNRLNSLLKHFTHQSNCVARFSDELTSIIVRLESKTSKARFTAAHKPILIFMSISDPANRCPSVRRIFYAVIIIFDQHTSNLWIASNFSFHAEDGRESVYPILFRVCTNDIYIRISKLPYILLLIIEPTAIIQNEALRITL